jgi:4-amino-4-deoxy-L-arabinose transferase-like glycosyltransferase
MKKLSQHKFFFLLLVFYLFLGMFMLDNYPRVWVDEPWESITAYTLITEGKMHNPVLENYNGYGRILLQPRILLDVALAPAFAVFGIGPVQGRLASVACGGFLLIAVYFLTLAFFSKRAALLAVWFTMIETMIFISYRTIRPEIYLVTLEMFSLLLLFRGLQKLSYRYFWGSGIIAGVALWTHPNAVLYVIAALVLFVFEFRKKFLRSPLVWSFIVAVFVGVLPYILYVIANDAQDSFATFFLQLENRQDVLNSANWFVMSLSGEWSRVVEYTQFPARILIVVIFASIWVFSLLSKKKYVRYIAVILLTNAVLSFLIIENKTILYSTSLLPMLCILTSVYIDELLGAPTRIMERLNSFFRPLNRRASFGILLTIILSVNQLTGDADLLWKQRNCSYTETVRELQAVIPTNSRVWGSITFWFGFYQQPFRSQYTYLRDVDTFKPQYMITGDTETWGKVFWRNVRDQAEAIIRQRGTLVAELPKSCYGDLKVYRLQW